MIKYLLIALLSFQVSAAEFTDDNFIFVGTCIVMTRQVSHDINSFNSKGQGFLTSYWGEVAKAYNMSIGQFIEACHETLEAYQSNQTVEDVKPAVKQEPTI